MVSGLPNEAVSHDAGTPFSLAMFSSDMARTRDDTPIIVRIRNEVQAIARATVQILCFIIFCLAFFDTI